MRPFDGYPDSWGSKRVSVFPIAGPNPYATYTAPSTGGQDVVLNGPSGVKTADLVIGGVSRSGLCRAEVVQYEAAAVNGQTIARAQVVLKWWVVSTNAAVSNGTDLSAEIVDLLIIGPK